MSKARNQLATKKNSFLRYIQDYRYNSILIKSLVIILLILMGSFAIIMLLVNHQMNRSISKEVGIMSVNTLNKTKDRMDTVMKEVVQISGHLSLDDDVMVTLLPDAGHLLGHNSIPIVMKQLKTHTSVVDYIDSIYIYSSKNDYVITENGLSPIHIFEDQTWYENLTIRIYEPGRMITRLKNDQYPYFISYIQPLRLSQLEFLGGIIINVDVGKLDELVISNVADSSENLMIVDERQNIIFSSNEAYLMNKFNQLPYYDKVSNLKGDGYGIMRLGQEEYVFTVARSKYFNWQYVSTVPLNIYDEYKKELNDFTLLLLMLIGFMSIGGALFISFYCYTPVMKILNLLKNPSMYEEQFDLEASFKKNEAEEISRNIIRNIYTNKKMQDDLKYYMKTIDQAHITALQAQLSPHFLFNTLENIRWRIIDEFKGENEITDSIVKLSEVLRVSIDIQNQVIPIREEVEHTKRYIDILQLRYGGKVQVHWHIDEQALDYPIVKISLQPLIENAVYHGIKPLRQKGLISIHVNCDQALVCIEIIDNGVGMLPSEVESLNADLGKKYLMKEDHIGIRNVNQRLKLLIGDRANMQVFSEVSVGTTVRMQIPIASE